MPLRGWTAAIPGTTGVDLVRSGVRVTIVLELGSSAMLQTPLPKSFPVLKCVLRVQSC